MAEAVEAPFNRPDAGFNALEGWTWIGCYGGYYLQSNLLEAFEHGFFRGPGPGFTIAPQGLLCAGHDTSRNPLQPSVLGLHKVDPS